MIQQLSLASAHVERLRREMNELASTLSENNIVMGIYGVGKTYDTQLSLRTVMCTDSATEKC